MSEMVEKVARAICQSRKFEAGEGTCSLICMDQLGDPRKAGCWHAARIHSELARAAIAAMREPTEEMIEACVKGQIAPAWLVRDAWQAMIDAALAENGQ